MLSPFGRDVGGELWLQCWAAEEGAASRGIGGGWSPAGPEPRGPGGCALWSTGQARSLDDIGLS